MKKLLSMFFFTILSLSIISCSDDDNGASPTNPNDLELGSMSAVVNGKKWEAQNATYFNSGMVLAGVQADVNLQNPMLSKALTISLSFALTGQSPEVGSGRVIAFYQEAETMNPTAVKSWNDTQGTFEFKTVSANEVSGTFEFKGTNEEDNTTKTVKGTFKVPRQ